METGRCWTAGPTMPWAWFGAAFALLVCLICEMAVAQEAVEGRETCSLVVCVIEAETGQPIQEAEIYLNGIRRGTSDPDGACFIDRISPGKYVVAAVKRGYARETSDVLVGAGAEQEIEILLEPGAVLMGVVLSESGEVVPDASVSLYEANTRKGSQQTRSDFNGIFSFEGLELNRSYELAVDHEDYVRQRMDELRISPDGPSLQIEVTLNSGALIRGVVTDEKAKPIEGAQLSLRDQGRWALTVKDGTYVLDRLEMRPAEVVVKAGGHCPMKKEILPEKKETKADFILAPGHRVSGRVVDEDTKPVRDVKISAYEDEFGSVGEAVSDDNGHFELCSLPPGRVKLRFMGEGYSDPGLSDVRVDGQPLVVTLKKTGHIVGRAVNQRGEPVTSFFIRLRPSGRESRDRFARLPVQLLRGMEFNNDKGEFELSGLTRDVPYNLFFRADDYAGREVQHIFPTKQEELKMVVIRLDEGVVFGGTVVDAITGRPVAGAEVSVVEQDSRYFGFMHRGEQFPTSGRAITDLDGKFQIEHITPGRHQVTVRHEDYALLRFSGVGFAASGDRNETDRRIPGGEGLELPPAGPDGIRDALIKLKKGGTIVGVCHGSDGEPLAGIRVAISMMRQYAVSDNDGAFVLDKVPEGTHVITFMNSNRGDAEGRWALVMEAVNVKAFEETKIDFRPYDGERARGRLTSKGDSSVRAYVVIQPYNQNYPRHIIYVGKDGSFEVPGLKPGLYRVSASSYSRGSRRRSAAQETVRVEHGAANEFVIELD